MSIKLSFFELELVGTQTKPITKAKSHPSSRTNGKRATLIALLTTISAATTWAQGDIPSGTLTSSGIGPSYTYNLTFSDGAAATSPIGSVWYAWIPFAFYLPGTPTSASAPSGWTAQIQGNSVEFFANSSANYILPGHSLSGFSYTANFTPAQLASAPNSGQSDAYTMGIESDAGQIFAVQTVPEPSVLALLGIGFGLCYARCRRAG